MLAATVIAAVRAATWHWLAAGGAASPPGLTLPDLIRRAVRQIAATPTTSPR